MDLPFMLFSIIMTIFPHRTLNFLPMIVYLTGIAGPSGYGSKTTAEQVAEDCLRSKPCLTAIVTGATSGLGAEIARVLGKNSVRVIIPAMRKELKKAEELKKMIQKGNEEAEIIISEIDLSSFASVQRFCSEFLSSGLPLHILVNNAGTYSKELKFSEDKIELMFATNYLGHFLLTELLLGKLIETASESGIEGRIVNVSSTAHNWVKTKELCFEKLLNPERFLLYNTSSLFSLLFGSLSSIFSYSHGRAYAQSKLATLLHAKELARQLKVIGKRSKCNYQCSASWSYKNSTNERFPRVYHRFFVFYSIQVSEIDITGSSNNILCCIKLKDNWDVWPILCRLQRSSLLISSK